MKISAMVLAGKYEPYLEYCIESIKDICDEIIIFHHPETDLNKLPMLKSDGQKIIDYTIADERGQQAAEDVKVDFAEWRNSCLALSTGDWILWLDADEVLAYKNGGTVTRASIEALIKAKPDGKFFSFTTLHFLWNYFTLDGRNNGEHWSMRLFKKEGAHFKREIHEYLEIPEGTQYNVTNPWIWHFGHTKGMEDLRQKYTKTMAIPSNPYKSVYGTKTPDEYCATHELFRGTRPIINYRGPLPRVMKLW